MAPSHVTILGAGLTGLTAAYRLISSPLLPSSTRITLVDSSRHIGGWVDSTRHAVGFKGQDGEMIEGELVLEGGPRSIRPRGSRGAPNMLRLIRDVGLEEAILPIPLSHPAAKNRYILDPLSSPSPIAIRLSPFAKKPAVLNQALPSILTEPFRRRNSPPETEKDESIHDFLTRRFNPATARLASAMMHGIYAASTTELSAQSVLRGVYDGEREYGSVIVGAFRKSRTTKARKAKEDDMKEWNELGLLGKMRESWSMYGLRGGMGTLTNKLENEIRRRGVEIRSGEAVSSIKPNPGNDVEIKTTSDTFKTSHVISTLPPLTLSHLLPASSTLPHLDVNPHTSLYVVSLVYAIPPTRIHPDGFGYLLPRTPASHNPYGILGCVFDSTALPSVDDQALEGKITKLTIMMGGPYWSVYEPNVHRPVDDDEAIEMATSHIQGVFPALKNIQSLLAISRSHQNAIPTYLPGHQQRLRGIHRAIKHGPWNGKLSLAGNGYGGVGVNDCVFSAEEAVKGIIDGNQVTGLERWADQ
ncbi:hypothetical protein BCR39DRAFT_493622 [Naematelia encephala]|uniref:Protoporphyrinogen oxidase n=1 Tax=Naematelia encephala TaxID=71784 RepID=A0A1Y2B9U7_9TREE|nr:hypothetical protein BCR39DRAFT_493622 [Naematelia encephala]